MGRVRPDIGKAAVGDSNLPAFKNFATLNIDQFAATNDHIGGRATCSNCDKTGGTLGPGFDVMYHFQI